MKRDFGLTYHLSDEERFCLFFKDNYQTACLIANRYVKDMDQSEDLVQDVFVALWERRGSFHQCVNLKNYLFAAVKNHALNLIQRDKRKIVSLSDLLTDTLPEESSESYDREAMAVNIHHAIDSFPPQCKKIFHLAYQKNLTYQEIADELNISKNTVKTQMGIAYKSLRLKLNHLVVIGLCIFCKKSK